ncbi:MAG: S-layer homology domain-containing protein [Oscillospiraceae bacterium]
MKTLKKTLCLVLAVVMAVGTLALSASATDFVDDADIEYNEAVEVLTGLGIINGKDGNKFDPEGTLTRAEGAKLVAYALLTPATAAKLKATSDPFSDVAASNWAAGSISYCVAENIINGYQGKFDPNGKLTGVAFAKMFLVALGIDGEYTGNNWDTNVVLAAEKAKLADGISGFDYYDEITREEACQMAFNAINYSKNGTTSSYVVKSGDDVLYSGTDAVTAMLMYTTAGDSITTETVSLGSVGSDVYGLKKGTTKDEFGRTSTTYTNGKTGTAAVTYATIGADAVLTYTTATTYGAIIKALGYTKATDQINFNVYDNSKTSTDVTGKDILDTGAGESVGAQGTLVEVYKTDTAKTYDLIIIDTYVDTLAAGDVVAKNTTTGADAYINLANPAGGSDLAYTTDAFKANDVVLYTVADGAVVNVVKAAAVSGNITATGADYVRVSGTQMKLAANNIDSVAIGTTAGYKNSTDVYTYYTDTYGNIIHAVYGTQTAANVNYLYLIDTASKKAVTGDGDNLFETSESSAARAQAKVIDLATGTVSIKNIAVVKNTAGKYVYADATGAATATEVTDTKPFSTAGYYTYTELSDGSIVIGSAVSTTSVSLTKDTAVIVPGASSVYANASTKVTVIEYTSNYAATSVTTYTGIANFPSTTLSEAALVIKDNNNVATSVTIVKAQNVASSVNYAIYKGAGENSLTDGQYYEFYVGGEVVSYVMSNTADFSATAGDVVGLTLTSGKLADKGAVADQTAKISGATVTYVDSTFAVATKTTVEDEETKTTTYVIYFASSCEVYDAGNSYAAASIAVGDVIDVYGSTALSGNNLRNAAFIVIAA